MTRNHIKESPFYSIDEIMDADLRLPFVESDESIHLITNMLDRDVSQRYGTEEVLDHPWLQRGGEQAAHLLRGEMERLILAQDTQEDE